jgi:diguanylate cyclase (GGDEF)-like protein
VLEENIVHESVPLGRVTVSIGIGFSERKRNLTPTALFERADRALYDAKAAGRNQISTRTEAVAERV